MNIRNELQLITFKDLIFQKDLFHEQKLSRRRFSDKASSSELALITTRLANRNFYSGELERQWRETYFFAFHHPRIVTSRRIKGKKATRNRRSSSHLSMVVAQYYRNLAIRPCIVPANPGLKTKRFSFGSALRATSVE